MNRRVIFPRSLEYLLAIAEFGSYTRAAEALHVSQPTLSQQIKHLEESLNTVLVDRSKRHVRLTDAGEVYLQYARRAWGELDRATRAIEDVRDMTRGSLRLGWTPITDYLACSLLLEFHSQYPGIDVSTFEMPQDSIEAAVAEDRIDVGIAFTKPSPPDDAQASGIEVNTLFEETLCLAVGSAHPRAGQTEPISVEELGREPLVMPDAHFALRRHVDRYCREHGIAPRVAVETDSLAVIIEMIQVGPLATILPSTIIKRQCGLYMIAPSPEIPLKVITLICRKNGYKSSALRAFSLLALDWAGRRADITPMRKLRPCPLAAAERRARG